MRIAIVGCGTAGGASALFLSRAGHEVVVFERVDDPRPVGAGIILQPTGQAVLARLGLEREVLDRGARLDGLIVRAASGRKIMELSYEDVGDLFGLGIHRGVLFQALFSAACREAEVRCGVSIESLRHGRLLVDAEGNEHGPFDVIIVADGARSKLRDDIPEIGQTLRPYPWGALWFLARDPETRFRGRLFQTVRGNARMLGFLPTGLGPEEGSQPLTSIYWSIRGDRVDAFRRAGVEAWKDELRSMLDDEARDAAEPLLAQIEHQRQVLFTSYNDVEMWPWAHDRVVFLGDAAHAMSPQLGQGCNLALLDALTLAECLDVFASDPTRALAVYSLRRRRHLSVYTQATRWLTPFFQGDVELLGELRDVFMPLAARVPFARALMTKSMAGVLGGWFGSTIALPR